MAYNGPMPLEQQCPRCGQWYARTTRVCVPCGVDLQTGKPIAVRVDRDTEDDDADEGRPNPLRVAGAFTLACLPGLRRPTVMAMSLIVTAVGVSLVLAGLIMLLSFFVLLSGMMMAGLGVLCYAQAVAWMIRGELALLNDCLVDFDGAQWNIFTLALLTPLAVIVGLGLWLMPEV